MVAGGLMKRNARFQVFNGVFFMMLLVGGWFYYPLGYFMIFCMVMAMGIGIVKGRWWCDWMCPRGSFWDRYLDIFSRRTKVKNSLWSYHEQECFPQVPTFEVRQFKKSVAFLLALK